MSAATLAPGFADPVPDAQATFRAALHAMAHPGRVMEAGVGLSPPAPLFPATAAVALALLDMDTPLWLDAAADTGEVRGWFAFHCGCPVTGDAAEAAFAIVAAPGVSTRFGDFSTGSDEAPERAATLIVQAPRFRPGQGRRLSGPGIDGASLLQVDNVPEAFWAWRAGQEGAFPRGVDVLFTAGFALCALPRTTIVSGAGG